MNRIAPNAFACICTVTVHKFWIPPFRDPPFGPVAIVHHREIKGETWRALIGIENDRVAPTPCLATWRESCGTRFLPSSSRSWCAGQAGRVHVHHESQIIDINRTIKIELQKLWVLIMHLLIFVVTTCEAMSLWYVFLMCPVWLSPTWQLKQPDLWIVPTWRAWLLIHANENRKSTVGAFAFEILRGSLKVSWSSSL